MRAMMPFDPRPLPDLDGIPILILAGSNDPLIPVDQAALLAALLGEAGADVTYEVVYGGHGLTGDDLSLAGGWLAKTASAASTYIFQEQRCPFSPRTSNRLSLNSSA